MRFFNGYKVSRIKMINQTDCFYICINKIYVLESVFTCVQDSVYSLTGPELPI
jgi:hypothetical protein